MACSKDKGRFSFSSFVTDNIWIWVYYVVVMSFPAYVIVKQDGSFSLSESRFLIVASTALFPGALLAALCALLLRRRSLWRRLAGGALTAFVTLFSFFETWMIFCLKTRVSDRIIGLVAETNAVEAGDFFNTYLLKSQSVEAIVLFPLACAALYFILRWLNRTLSKGLLNPRPILTRGVPIAAVALVTGSLSLNILYLTDVIPWNKRYYHSLWQYWRSLEAYRDNADNVRKLEEAVAKSDGRIAEGVTPPARIVWVIGESDNRHHSALYGYRLPTTPRMSAELAKGNLVVFNDVSSYAALTSRMMEILFSPYVETDTMASYADTPILPALLRKAGYMVRLHDNQVTLTRNGDNACEKGSCYFLNSPRLSNASFDRRNSEVWGYDSEFLDAEAQVLRHPETRPAVDIFHLMGQHFEASSRFPEGFGRFKPADYEWRRDLGEKEKRELADYDNATLFVDTQLGRIIDLVSNQDAVVIYMSDHGEEVHDFRKYYGRETSAPGYRELAESLMDVPFVVYTTSKFRELHPALYTRLAANASRPWSLAYFSHFMLDLAGIESRWLRKEYSPLSPEWTNPPRIMEWGRNRDSLPVLKDLKNR